jgi:hypothetical protein
MKTLLFASVLVATAAFGLAWGVSPDVASAQEAVEPGEEVADGEEDQVVEADQCYTIWFDVQPGPGKKCVRGECCHPLCEDADPTCRDI